MNVPREQNKAHLNEKINYRTDNYIERWVCNKCGAPCNVSIATTDRNLPEHAKGPRFRVRRCVCEESHPQWDRLIDAVIVSTDDPAKGKTDG